MATHFISYIPPYDEDEIVGLVSDIFRDLTRLGHFADAPIHYPPRTGHDLDLSQLVQGTVIDDRVLSLMRRLPVTRPEADPPFVTVNQVAVDYTNPAKLASCRDIDSRSCFSPMNHQLDTTNARATDMILFDRYEAGDATVVLDIEKNTIRIFHDSLFDDFTNDESRTEEEVNAYVAHYRNHPTQSAPDYLRDIHSKILKAQVIPTFKNSMVPLYLKTWPANENADRAAKNLQKTLLTEYKWPGPDFNEEGWKREGPALLEAVLRRSIG